MHKNPFVPQPPPYNPPQPPLPPGPPPPQSTHPDYSAYWTAATAAAVNQPQAQQAYNPQWPSVPAPLPPRPPPEQSALYANYGYGGSQNFQWQQQQQQQQQQRSQQALFQPPQPQPQPQPPPQPPAMQPQPYTPYQPQAVAGFVQPYVPQAVPIPQQPAPVVQNLYGQQPQQPGRQYFPQQQRHSQPFNHPPPQQQQLHHTPPQHLPPAKRQKFDGPGTHNRGPQPLPLPPQFQPSPQPSASASGSMMQQHQQPMAAGSFSSGRGGTPGGGPMGRGGGPGNRGGNRGRGGSMMNNRGGGGRGRGSMYGGGRGSSQAGNQLKSHGSRGNFGGGRDYGNRDHGNRRGSSFSGGGGHHQGAGGASFRGRGQGHAHAYPHFSRGGRHDGGSGGLGSRDGPMASSSFLASSSGSGKRDENRRNFTDFKIVGLEILDLPWTWGIIPTTKGHIKAESISEGPSSSPSANSEDTVSQAASRTAKEEPVKPPTSSSKTREDLESTPVKAETASDLKAAPTAHESHPISSEALPVEMPAPVAIPPPPSRMRIYFHSPVTPDDSRLIPSGASFSIAGSDEAGSRRGKRKKSEDDDGDLEGGRAPPPPPGGSRPERSMSDDRFERASTVASVEPSVAETASEGDWLMAAIGEDEGDGEDDGDELQPSGNDPTNSGDGSTCVAEGEYGSVDDGVATQVDDSEGVRDLADEPSSLMDGHTLDNIREASPVTSLAATQVVDVPETQDLASSLDTSGGSDVAVAEQLAVAPDSEQLDGALSGAFEISGPNEAQNDPVAEAPPSEEGPFVISPSSSAPAVPDSSVIASSSSSDTSVAAPPTESAPPDEEQPADHAHSPDVPPPNAPEESTASPSIVERSLTQGGDPSDPRAKGAEDQDDSATQPEVHFDGPASSGTSALISGSTASIYGEPNHRLSMKAEPQPGIRTPSPNRLSISYAAGTKRLVINAEIVEKLKIHRSEGRVEILLQVKRDGVNGLNGIIIESLSEATKSYSSLETLSPTVELDPTVPPFSKANIPFEVTLLVYLDRARPLSEPKWVKSGDVQEWLKSMFGRMFWFTGDAASGWDKKIEVLDPDPAPTIRTVLDSWAANSTVGLQTERQRFVRTHMAETDNILEILLRLVRGERATPFTQAAPAISAPSVAGPLLAALSPASAHGPQQTHVSLAVLAVWRMTLDYALKALQEKGRTEAEERLGEIIRCLPSHLLYKSLDGIFKEWRVEKKSGR